MVDEELTFKKFGYYAKDLSLYSNKKVIYRCGKCNCIQEKPKGQSIIYPLCSSCAKKGIPNLKRRGKTHSKETKLKISLARKNKTYDELFGEKKSKEIRKKMSEAKKGKKCYLYKDGRTSLIRRIYTLFESGEWRNKIFKRDHFTCQKCGLVGGKLEAHHIKKLTLILKEFLQLYPNLNIEKNLEQLLELAKNYASFWDISNGLTLCQGCHSLVEKEEVING